MPDFASKPYDGEHSILDASGDWQNGGGVMGMLDRAVSYGNYGGPGNIITSQNAGYTAQQRSQDANYDESSDPKLAGNPAYAPIDPMDAAFKAHDSAYDAAYKGNSMFGWDGMHDDRQADKDLVSAVGSEMSTNGDKYSSGAKTYAEGVEGFFGGRELGMEAADWAGGKVTQAENGVAKFAGDAGKWSSLSDAGHGLANGAEHALSFAGDTAAQAVGGVEDAAATVGKLGLPGAVTAAAGLGDAVVAGGVHAAEGAWDDVKSLGASLLGH